MFGAGDDFILQFAREVAEIVAVAGHAHDQVAMLFRGRLGLRAGFRRERR